MPDIRAASPARRFLRPAVPALALALLAFASVARAQQWSESGDAGDVVATAQATSGAGPLTTLLGNLDSPTDADLFCVHLTSVPPAGLPIAYLQCVINQGPNVYLFDAAGNGVFVNETCSAGNKTIVAPNVSLPVGTYYVAVAYYGLTPMSAGGAIWNTGVPGQRAPDGPGAGQPLIGWSGTPTVGQNNPYQIGLAYMEYCSAATPTLRGTWGTLKSRYR